MFHPPPSSEAGVHLDSYLSELSRMPDNKDPTKAIKSPVVNPPTPFRNTPRSGTASSKILPTLEASSGQRLSKIVFESETESSSSSEETSPLSVISPMTAPSYPSAMSTEPVTTEVPKAKDGAPETFSEAYLVTDERPTPEKRKNSVEEVRGPDLGSLPRESELKKSPSMFEQQQPTDLSPSRCNVDHETSIASSLQDSVSIRMFQAVEIKVSAPPNKSDEATRLEAAVSSLALRQETEIRRLLEQQEHEREELRQMFERQRRELIEAISSQIRNSQQSR